LVLGLPVLTLRFRTAVGKKVFPDGGSAGERIWKTT